jgi:uncharacterized protein YbjT (DUF2867 family)
MKIVVIGGSGLIGSKLVAKLGEHGHEAVPASPASGVNTLTGEGLAEVLTGADVVVDVSNSPSFADADVLEFFETATTNLLAAAAEAGVGHCVALSVVGADRLPDSGYLRAKVAQEQLITKSGLPYSIVRATQFFEFMDAALSWTADETTVRLPATLIQPMAAADVARAVADVSAGAPLQGTRDIAGPEVFTLDELGKITLTARGDHRNVVTDNTAGMFAAVSGDALIAKDGAVIAKTGYREWLAR